MVKRRAAVTLYGDCAFGQVAAHEAMALGLRKRISTVSPPWRQHNSHHIGLIGHWAEQCAAAGFVLIHFVSVVGIQRSLVLFHGRAQPLCNESVCGGFPS
ncbi:Ldh family oxidoreductase [Escherichia coli]